MATKKPRARHKKTKEFKKQGSEDRELHSSEYGYWRTHENSILSKAITAKTKGKREQHDAFRKWKQENDAYYTSMEGWYRDGWR